MKQLTREWAPEAMELITATHRQDYYATITTAAGSSNLSISDGSVTFSEDWSPRMQATLTVASSGAPSRLDPRAPSTLDIYAGYVFPAMVSDVHRLSTAHLDHREAPEPGDMVTLRASSAETYAQETRWFSAKAMKSFPGVLEAIQYFVNYAMPGAEFSSVIGTRHRPDLVAAVEVDAGATMWDMVDSISVMAGLRVYADEFGIWQVARRSTIAGEASAYLIESPTRGIVTETNDIMSRDGYYDAAIVKFSWRDGTEDREILGTWAPPTTGIRGAGCKTFTQDRPGPISQSAANETARQLVKNLSTRGDSYVLTSVAAYWLRDGDTVQVRLSSGADVRHIVRSVIFNLAAGTMTVTTREPSNLGLD